jgi:fatty-acid desaturase
MDIKSYLRPNSSWFKFQHLALLGFFVYALTLEVPNYYWYISFAMWFTIIALGINFTYHRLLSHKSFKTYKPVEYAFSYLGLLANTGSALAWVMMHRQHHHHTDKKYDPHSPHEHGWKILFSFYDDSYFKEKPSAALMYARHMLRDKVHILMHDYYHALIIATYAIVYFTLGFEALLFGLIVPSFMGVFSTNMSNYFNHKSGYRTYDTKDGSRNTPWMLIFALGENWHNNHHAKPSEPLPGEKWWEIDPVSPFVRLLRITK